MVLVQSGRKKSASVATRSTTQQSVRHRYSCERVASERLNLVSTDSKTKKRAVLASSKAKAKVVSPAKKTRVTSSMYMGMA